MLAFFAYRVRHGGGQLSAADGLLLGFMVGAGFGFHEDAGYGRVWGGGPGDNLPWSALFPTVGGFRGSLLPYHDTLAAVVGLAIGFAFLYRRYRLAWVVPLAVWLIVLVEHVTGNLADISGRLPLPAEVLRTLIFGGQGPLAVLVIGIVVAVVLESRILQMIARRDPLFPPIHLNEFIDELRQRTAGNLRRLQAMRVYARQRRSAYYALWSEPSLAVGKRHEMAAKLYVLGIEAGVPVDRTFTEHWRGDEAPPTQDSGDARFRRGLEAER
ncbi:MAG: PrsW family glutamic-type intramembrane protease [Candidatus Limnocylindria bacterium]